MREEWLKQMANDENSPPRSTFQTDNMSKQYYNEDSESSYENLKGFSMIKSFDKPEEEKY